MSKQTSVTLGEHYDKFIQSEIKSGRYKSVSEVIKSGLRILEEEKRKVYLINETLTVGEESGKPGKFDNENFKQRMKDQLNIDH